MAAWPAGRLIQERPALGQAASGVGVTVLCPLCREVSARVSDSKRPRGDTASAGPGRSPPGRRQCPDGGLGGAPAPCRRALIFQEGPLGQGLGLV